MKKRIRELLFVILTAVCAVAVVLLGKGYIRSVQVQESLPVEKAVTVYTSGKDYVSFEELDPDFVHAVVAVEDKRYFERSGPDFIALCRAIYMNFLYKRPVEGGSTIPQQIAKNLWFVGTERGLDEKIAEVFLMGKLQDRYTKEELLALYANMNYYGDGYWGIGQASRGYYSTGPDQLSVAQAAMLAGIPNAPGIYQLSTGHDLAVQRQRKVLQRMLAEGYLTEAEYQEALNEAV